MMIRALWVLIFLLGLAGCGSVPVGPSSAQLPWHDKAFEHDPALVTVSAQDLFRLDAGLQLALGEAAVQEVSKAQRLQQLMTLVFGPDRQRFSYAAGHSSTAVETWRLRRGDCLSLAVLTYAVGRAMNMQVQVQEVPVTPQYDRRGNVDFVNQHINVIFRRAHRDHLEESLAQDVVVDFDPDAGSGRPGRPLTESAVLARYYNNIAAEHLAKGRRHLAYAHFKAAILTEPGYASSYTNLALLYRQAGLHADAERLLRHALTLSDGTDMVLHSLHRLLVDQGRDAEAAGYERELQARREQDPYYWVGLGFRHLGAGETRLAIRALERARGLSNGFAEVHRYLAVAYWRAGEQARANEQLAMLASIDGGTGGSSTLKKKLRAAQP